MAPQSNENLAAPARRKPALALRLALVAALVLAVVGVLWAALGFALPPAQVRALVRQQLAATLTRPARFADVRVGIWPPVRLTVQQPELAEPGGFERGAAFRAALLHLDLDLWALLRRQIVVRRLLIDQPALHLVIRPDGSTNLDSLVRAPQVAEKQGQPMELDVRELTIQNGKVLLDDLGKSRRTSFALGSRVAFRASGGAVPSMSTSGDTRVAGLKWGPLSAQRESDLGGGLDHVEWRIQHRAAWNGETKRLALERLAVRFGGTDLTLAGVVDDPGPRAHLDLRAVGTNVQLRDVLAQFAAADIGALKVQGSGRLDFDLGLRGAFGPDRVPSLNGTLRVDNAQLRYPGAPAAVRDVRFTARFTPDSISIPALDAWVLSAQPGAGSAPLHSSLTATHLADPWVRFDVKGVAELAMIAPLLAASDVRLGGRAAVAVQGEGRAKDSGSMALAGQARLMDVSVESPRLPKKFEKINAQLRFSPQQAAIEGLQMTAGKSRLALDATVTRPLALMAAVGKVPPANVSFNLRSPYLDLDEITPQGGGNPVLPNATGHGAVTIAHLKSKRLDVSQVTAAVDLAPTQLKVSSYSVQAYGGTATGTAHFDLTNPALPAFGLETSLHQIDPNDLLSQWTPARGLIHGTLDANLSLGGQGSTAEIIKQSLNANGLAAVTNGRIGPGPALRAIAQATGIQAFENIQFKDLKLPFRVANGRMITDPVVLDGSFGRWQLVGGIGFDATLDYAVSATLPPEAANLVKARSSALASALGDSSGNLLLDLRVSGPAAAPKVTWDTHATRDRLIGKLSQAILDQRQKIETQVAAEVEARRKAAADSARIAIGQLQQATRDSLRNKARNVLEGFFKDKTKPPAPPQTAPPPATTTPPATAPPHTATKP
jgi:hypothetical protein